MQKGKVYKATAIILFALIFVGAVIVGDFELLRAFTGGDFNFGVFIYIAATGLLSCIPIYGIGDVLEEKKKCRCDTALVECSED